MTDPVSMLKAVAERLADLREQVVFVGGTSIALLLTDVAGHSPRSTDDVDAISEVNTRLELARFEARLLGLGFKPDRNRTTCSWLVDGMMIDVMPMNGELLGLASRWFPEVARHSRTVDLGGLSVRVASAPYLLAIKLEAYKDRAPKIRSPASTCKTSSNSSTEEKSSLTKWPRLLQTFAITSKNPWHACST